MIDHDDGSAHVDWQALGAFAPDVPPGPDIARRDMGPGGSLLQDAQRARARRIAAATTPWRSLRARWGPPTSGEARLRARARREQVCAAVLDELTAAGWEVLHDRLLPRGAHRLAHVAVGPAGVAVITELPETGPLSFVGDGEERQLYAGSLHLRQWLAARRWETEQLEGAIAAAHPDVVWMGPTAAIAVDVPEKEPLGAPAAGPPELPYEWDNVLFRPVAAVVPMLLGLPAPMSPVAVRELAAVVADLCRPAGRQSNSDG